MRAVAEAGSADARSTPRAAAPAAAGGLHQAEGAGLHEQPTWSALRAPPNAMLAPPRVQAGKEVTIYYNPDNTNLHGRQAIWIK